MQATGILVKRFLVLFFLFGGILRLANAQVVHEHLSSTGIYTYLDEMANLRIIELNTAIKPYSRQLIHAKLIEIKAFHDSHPNQLNKRQQSDLVFFLKSFLLESDPQVIFPTALDIFKNNKALATAAWPIGLHYKDSAFSVSLQPLFGASISQNKNGVLTHSFGGASLIGYIGKNLGFYTNVRDNNESRLMIHPDYFQQRQGAPVKNFGAEGVDYTEARGGLTYSWEWGSVGLIKEHIEWGLGYNGTNIQSGNTPSFAMLKLELKPVRWFEFNYYHGSLVSEVVDSSNSYWSGNTFRASFFNKFMAANMFTFVPIKGLNLSFGNSIVYTNESGNGPHAAFLIPFLFYKSVDITLSAYEKGGYASNNNQFFFTVSSRNINRLHLYFSLFADDIAIRYFSDKDQYNSFSYKAGFRLSNYPIQNISLTGEYTRTNPYVYQHHTLTQDYRSNNYSMGHYLRDNAQEVYFGFRYNPIRGLNLELSYTLAQKGDDYDINNPQARVHSDPVLENIIWQNRRIQISANYEIFYNTLLFASWNFQNISGQNEVIEKYTPEYYLNTKHTLTAGFHIGF